MNNNIGYLIIFFNQNDSLQRNLDDFEKVVKVQHSRSVETELLEKNLKDLKIKYVVIKKSKIYYFSTKLSFKFYRLYNEEQARKTDLNDLKVRYDNRMSVLSEELKNSQFQTLRFKRERDSFKQMLDSVDSTTKKGNHSNIYNYDNQVIYMYLK